MARFDKYDIVCKFAEFSIEFSDCVHVVVRREGDGPIYTYYVTCLVVDINGCSMDLLEYCHDFGEWDSDLRSLIADEIEPWARSVVHDLIGGLAAFVGLQ